MQQILKPILLVSALLVLPPLMLSPAFAREGDSVETRVSDSVITTKIKAAFAKDKLVDATDIKIETDKNGVVGLTGTAKTEAEARQAVKLAKSVKGVVSVNDYITITDHQ